MAGSDDSPLDCGKQTAVFVCLGHACSTWVALVAYLPVWGCRLGGVLLLPPPHIDDAGVVCGC